MPRASTSLLPHWLSSIAGGFSINLLHFVLKFALFIWYL